MRERATRVLIAIAATGAALVTSACQSPAPTGPVFEQAEWPAPNRARVYVYRADPRASRSRIRVELDGREVGALANGEYETLELSPGPHRLRAGLRSTLFVAWGWNEQPLRLSPGETLYVRLSVRLSEHAAPTTGRSVEIAGRTSGVASENVFIERVGEAQALQELTATRRRSP